MRIREQQIQAKHQIEMSLLREVAESSPLESKPDDRINRINTAMAAEINQTNRADRERIQTLRRMSGAQAA